MNRRKFLATVFGTSLAPVLPTTTRSTFVNVQKKFTLSVWAGPYHQGQDLMKLLTNKESK